MRREETKQEACTLSTKKDDTSQTALLGAQAAIEKKAENVKVLYLGECSSFTDYFVICSGISTRQVQAIADSIQNTLRPRQKVISSEGYQDGRWVLLDYGDVVFHIFLDAVRDYYNLELLWSDAPRVKLPSEFYGPAAVRLN